MSNDLPDWASTVYQPDVAIGGAPISYINGFTSKTLTIPNGVHILNVVLPGFPNISLITIAGVTSGATYLAETPNTSIFAKQYFVLIPQLVDTQVTVDISAGAAGTAYFSGILAPVAVAALPQNPAPWQGPNQPPAYMSFGNPGPGASATIIAGQSDARSIWLHGMHWLWDTAAPTVIGTFQDGSSVVAAADAAISAGIPRYMDFGGAKLSGGNPLVFKQSGAAAANSAVCYGSVSYSVF